MCLCAFVSCDIPSVCVRAHTRTCTCTARRLPTYTHTHMKTHRHTKEHALIQTYTQPHTRTHAHTHTRTHAQLHMHTTTWTAPGRVPPGAQTKPACFCFEAIFRRLRRGVGASTTAEQSHEHGSERGISRAISLLSPAPVAMSVVLSLGLLHM